MALEKLTSQIETFTSELGKAHTDLQDKLNLVTPQGIEAKLSFQYRGVRVAIQHETLNWNEFVTVHFEKGRRSESNEYKFEFSHGSGGWNEAPVEVILKATQDIFAVTGLIKNILEKSVGEIDGIIAAENELRGLYDEKNRIEEAAANLAKIEEIEVDHIRVTPDNVLGLLAENSHIDTVVVSRDTSYISSISDKGRDRRSLFIGDRGIGFNDLSDILTRSNIYIAKEA